jgi:hypothetical protein
VTWVTATENRFVHVDPDVEPTLAALESAGLVVVTHLVPVGPDAKTAGWLKAHCPRECHESVSIRNMVLTPLVKQEFFQWVATMLTAHDQADVGKG